MEAIDNSEEYLHDNGDDGKASEWSIDSHLFDLSKINYISFIWVQLDLIWQRKQAKIIDNLLQPTSSKDTGGISMALLNYSLFQFKQINHTQTHQKRIRLHANICELMMNLWHGWWFISKTANIISNYLPIMNREFIYTNTYNGLNYPTNQPPPPRE